ncbi:MAG: hypothetical protein PVH61_34360 [Candidatus Aminicenantes bacterium]|jgi:hypothetical protein
MMEYWNNGMAPFGQNGSNNINNNDKMMIILTRAHFEKEERLNRKIKITIGNRWCHVIILLLLDRVLLF